MRFNTEIYGSRAGLNNDLTSIPNPNFQEGKQAFQRCCGGKTGKMNSSIETPEATHLW